MKYLGIVAVLVVLVGETYGQDGTAEDPATIESSYPHAVVFRPTECTTIIDLGYPLIRAHRYWETPLGGLEFWSLDFITDRTKTSSQLINLSDSSLWKITPPDTLSLPERGEL